jgi:hypothetical protein
MPEKIAPEVCFIITHALLRVSSVTLHAQLNLFCLLSLAGSWSICVQARRLSTWPLCQ